MAMTAAVPDPTVEALLAAHRTNRCVMVGWSARHGRDSDKRYGWDCSCGEHSPDQFKVYLTLDEAEAGRFAHLAAVLAPVWVADRAAEVERAVEEAAVRVEAEIEDGGTSKFSDGLTWAARIIREGQR